MLTGVSLTVRPREVHCLLGANGAGKTTLIRTVLGRVRPRSGRIERAPGGIGLVPQDIALFPRLTARENLAVFGRLAGLRRAVLAERVGEAARATGIEARLDQRVATLSGGWKRRVNIAAAILHRPGLLILDEPLAGVDPAARARLHEVIGALAAGGMGILMTTHDIAEAQAACGHAAILAGGRIVRAGPIARLLEERFGGRLALILAPAAPVGAVARARLSALGFGPPDGAPTALVADDHAGLALVAEARAAGIALAGFAIERPGLARLYDLVSQEAA